MRGWKDLEVVETIYEEEDHEEIEECYSSSPSTTSTSSSLLLTPSTHLPSSSLDNTVQAWSLATGFQTDVLIKVQDQSFRLHKDPLVSKSGYLKRELKDSSVINLTPPLNITAETFSTVADFCYSSYVVITPFNVAALRIAAELLDMNEDNNNNNHSEENLKFITESYFSKAVTGNKDYAAIILRSCLGLLPEAEETALLASRCIESLDLMDGNEGICSWMDEVGSLNVDDFDLIADSMHYLLTRSHDLLYKIVDSYLKENCDRLKEEEKNKLCSSIDCNKLSSNVIVNAVQNPRMPLRFIIRAMLVEQFNTRDSIVTTLSMKNNNQQQQQQQYKKQPKKVSENKEIMEEESAVLSLGMILQRDAALRQSAQLKASVESTSSKIERLEREILSMKKVLYDHDIEKKKREIGNDIASGRSVSLRFNTPSSENKIERGERGSTSLVNYRFSNIGVSSGGERNGGGAGSSSTSSSVSTPSLERLSSLNDNPKRRTTFGWKLMNGLKSAFRMSSSSSTTSTKGVAHDINEIGTTVEVSNDIVLNGGDHDHEDEHEDRKEEASHRHRRGRSLV
ncbi:hypothetical protein C5167_024525 [Papaver somniferum]|uniref:NPH3 domain-containing protein n=1 Tax=Papaver somniferum TaxID=3469 RepID=A0A4Y7JS50_PAPSO|nr:BTB/POZ domain-containing protein At3g49900-like [Papaver somniferum]RZC62771.1 hypothetical protein C5167_024525 [Papaver somniferum]